MKHCLLLKKGMPILKKIESNVIILAVALVFVLVAGVLVANFSYLTIPILLVLLVAIGVSIYVIDKPYTALVLISFLLPFERVGAFELAGSTVRASQLVALLMIASWLMLAFHRRKALNQRNPLLVFILLFFAASMLSFVNAVNFERAITVFLFEAFVMVVAVAMPNLLTSKKLVWNILSALFISSIVVSLFGVYQFLGDMAGLPPEITGLREQYTKIVFGFPRVQSTALEPLYFGNYLLIPVGLALALFLGIDRKKRIFSNTFLASVIFLGGLNILLTVSRGAYIGFAVMVVIIGFVYLKSFLKPSRFIPLTLLMGVALLGLLTLIGLEEENVETFIEHTTNITSGAGVVERFTTYEDALVLVGDHPILGVGVGNFGPYVAQNPNISPEKGWLIVNNVYLEILAERGILGFSIFISMLLFIVIRSIKALRVGTDPVFKTILTGLLVSFVAVFVQYVTFSILYIFHVWFLIGLIVSIQNILLQKTHERSTDLDI